MKKITLLLALISFTMNAQTEIGQTLRNWSENPNLTNPTIGCCVGDPDNHPDTNEDLCVFQVYTIDTSLEAGGDIFFNTNVTFRNCEVQVIGGGNFIVNSEGGFSLNIGTDFCSANLVVESNSNFFNSVAEFDAFNETLNIKDYTYINNRIKFTQDVNLTLYSLLGLEVISVKASDYTFNGLSVGVYVLKYTLDNKVKTEKIVIR